MVRKIKPSAEHERWWAETMVKIGGGAPDDPADSVYASISPEMQEYREKMEAKQAEAADSSSSNEAEEDAVERQE